MFYRREFAVGPPARTRVGCHTGITEQWRGSELNGFRASHGLSQLRTDATLTALASEHAGDMARRDSLDHDGFMAHRGPRGARAENVAYGCKDSPCVIQQWVNSSGHRKNMLIPSINRYGLASATSPSGKKYWTLLVGE
jgi:uncharacterized protein YkwD